MRNRFNMVNCINCTIYLRWIEWLNSQNKKDSQTEKKAQSISRDPTGFNYWIVQPAQSGWIDSSTLNSQTNLIGSSGSIVNAAKTVKLQLHKLHNLS